MPNFGPCSRPGCTRPARHVTVSDDGQMQAWCYTDQASAVSGGPTEVDYGDAREQYTPRQRLIISAATTLEFATWFAGCVLALATGLCLVALFLIAAGADITWGNAAVAVMASAGVLTLLARTGRSLLERAVLRRRAAS